MAIFRQKREHVKFEEGREYTPKELENLAEQFLRDEAYSPEDCDCPPPGYRDEPCKCEGKQRGIKGENPILFEDHYIDRRRREVYNSTGAPDPEIVSGLYNRTHPKGRKTSTPEQRRLHGASWYIVLYTDVCLIVACGVMLSG